MFVLVTDAETIGLHGEVFAIAVVVVDTEHPEKGHLDEFFAACPSRTAHGAQQDRAWVLQNIPEDTFPQTNSTPRAARDAFWDFWIKWKSQGKATIMGDCAWPVETGLLHQCIADDPDHRKWDGPYPLLDLAPMLFVLGNDPLENFKRQPDELPAHNPLADSRQSARIFLNLLSRKG